MKDNLRAAGITDEIQQELTDVFGDRMEIALRNSAYIENLIRGPPMTFLQQLQHPFASPQQRAAIEAQAATRLVQRANQLGQNLRENGELPDFEQFKDILTVEEAFAVYARNLHDFVIDHTFQFTGEFSQNASEIVRTVLGGLLTSEASDNQLTNVLAPLGSIPLTLEQGQTLLSFKNEKAQRSFLADSLGIADPHAQDMAITKAALNSHLTQRHTALQAEVREGRTPMRKAAIEMAALFTIAHLINRSKSFVLGSSQMLTSLLVAEGFQGTAGTGFGKSESIALGGITAALEGGRVLIDVPENQHVDEQMTRFGGVYAVFGIQPVGIWRDKTSRKEAAEAIERGRFVITTHASFVHTVEKMVEDGVNRAVDLILKNAGGVIMKHSDVRTTQKTKVKKQILISKDHTVGYA